MLEWNDSGRSIACSWSGREIANYVYLPDVPVYESPKPYFHPVSTLDGSAITSFRPKGHPWHQGISMTLTLVGNTNFWGGPTYRREDGYQDRDNQGSQRHHSWFDVSSTKYKLCMDQSIAWETPNFKQLLKERRRQTLDFSEAQSGYWKLDFESQLVNVSSEDLALDTYASREGLTGSPYTGFQWRGPTEFLNHPDGQDSDFSTRDETIGIDDIHGRKWPWIRVAGRSQNGHPATLVLMDHPTSARHPTTFFVRKGSSQAAFSFVGHETLNLPDGETLRLKHRILVGDGAWSVDRVNEAVERQRDEGWGSFQPD